MFRDNTIKKRVLATLTALIDKAQANYENEVEKLDDACRKAHEDLDTELVLRKASVADRLVDSIVGKFK